MAEVFHVLAFAVRRSPFNVQRSTFNVQRSAAALRRSERHIHEGKDTMSHF
jgi:hypothetical protein